MTELKVTSKEAIARLGRVAVIMGGNSAEREVSLKSGRAVLDALLAAGVDAFGIDAAQDLIGQLQAGAITQVFNILHGRGGEDGKLQGLLDFMGIPYTGSRVLGSALAMDKIRTKHIWLQIGLPTPNFTVLNASSDWDEVLARLGKAVVKPVREGSSIGISIVETGDDMRSAYERACVFDSEVMAEQYVDGTEFTVAIVDGVALPVIEFHTPHKFYDYDAKYIANDTQYLCPAPLDEETTRYLQDLSLQAFNAVGCEGWGRVDIMRDQQGRFCLLEVNTVPGMTDHSLVPMAATAHGLSFTELLLQILAAKPR